MMVVKSPLYSKSSGFCFCSSVFIPSLWRLQHTVSSGTGKCNLSPTSKLQMEITNEFDTCLILETVIFNTLKHVCESLQYYIDYFFGHLLSFVCSC